MSRGPSRVRNPTPVVYSRFLNDLNFVAPPKEKEKLSPEVEVSSCPPRSLMPRASQELADLPANHPLTILANASLRAGQRSGIPKVSTQLAQQGGLLPSPPVSGRWPTPEPHSTTAASGGGRRASFSRGTSARTACPPTERQMRDSAPNTLQV